MARRDNALPDLNEALGSAGWVCLTHEELSTLGEYYGASRGTGWWCKGSSGELAYYKIVRPEKAACELLGERLGVLAGVPCPKIDMVPLKRYGLVDYVCISQALGYEQQTLEVFSKKNTDANALAQVSDYISYALPFAEFVGHWDVVRNDTNIIVTSWFDKNGKNVFGAYFIDRADLDFEKYMSIKSDWTKTYNKYKLNLDMIESGLNALDRISEKDIERTVKDVCDYCGLDRNNKIGFHGVSLEAVTKQLCDNRERLLATRRMSPDGIPSEFSPPDIPACHKIFCSPAHASL